MTETGPVGHPFRKGDIKMKHKTALTAIALLLAAVVMGCTTTQQGTVLGGGIGAGTGAIIGHQSGDAGEGALIGGAIGAITGAIVGHEIDKNRQPARQPTYYEEYGGQHEQKDYYGGDYYEGDYSPEGRKWVPEHEEIRVYTAPDGSRYEKRILVPGHYE